MQSALAPFLGSMHLKDRHDCYLGNLYLHRRFQAAMGGNMGVRTLFNDARFVGQAEGDRRKYYVFEAAAGYLVVAPQGRNSYSVTVIQREAPEVISHKFRGSQITVSTLKAKGHRPDLFKQYFDRLNSLYVMVAMRKAKKLKKRLGKAMVFKISKARQ